MSEQSLTRSDIWLARTRDVTITGTLWAGWVLFWLIMVRRVR
jgi:hypothetical protein